MARYTDSISGLGVGIAAASFARQGYEVDIVGKLPTDMQFDGRSTDRYLQKSTL